MAKNKINEIGKNVTVNTAHRRTDEDVNKYLEAWYSVFDSLHKQPITISFENGKTVEVKNAFISSEFGFNNEQVGEIYNRQIAHRNVMRMRFFHDYRLVWCDQHDLGLLEKGVELGIIENYEIANVSAVVDMRVAVASPVILVKVVFNEDGYVAWLNELREKVQSASESIKAENTLS